MQCAMAERGGKLMLAERLPLILPQVSPRELLGIMAQTPESPTPATALLASGAAAKDDVIISGAPRETWQRGYDEALSASGCAPKAIRI